MSIAMCVRRKKYTVVLLLFLYFALRRTRNVLLTRILLYSNLFYPAALLVFPPPTTPLLNCTVPKALRDKYEAAGQGHVFKFVDEGKVREKIERQTNGRYKKSVSFCFFLPLYPHFFLPPIFSHVHFATSYLPNTSMSAGRCNTSSTSL